VVRLKLGFKLGIKDWTSAVPRSMSGLYRAPIVLSNLKVGENKGSIPRHRGM